MQHEFVPSANVDQLVSPSLSPLLFRPSDHRIPSPSCHTTGCNKPGNISHYLPNTKVNQYASSPPIPGTPPISVSSSPCSFEDEDPSAIKNRLYLARLALQYQQIADRYELCLTQLQDAEREAEAISLQNNTLRIANDQLYRRLNIDPADIKFRNPANIEYPPISLLDEHFRRLSLAEPPDEESPTSVFGFHENPPLGKKSIAVGDKRLTLPKSISVRSTGYLKIHQTGASCSEPNRLIRNRPPTPVMQQKVYLSGAGKKNAGDAEDPVELDLYNQGMLKTELCNKWQESGECPYGQHCQFAHGIDELRPVIRHPRYKTELCRMVVSGDTCPYGHRCHFRHAISPHDRLHRPT